MYKIVGRIEFSDEILGIEKYELVHELEKHGYYVAIDSYSEYMVLKDLNNHDATKKE